MLYAYTSTGLPYSSEKDMNNSGAMYGTVPMFVVASMSTSASLFSLANARNEMVFLRLPGRALPTVLLLLRLRLALPPQNNRANPKSQIFKVLTTFPSESWAAWIKMFMGFKSR